VNWAREPAREALARMTAHFQGSDAHLMAIKQLTAMAHRQAAVMAFADVFLLLTVLFVALAALGFIMKRPAPVAAEAAGH
jgi:DHA2 family multidrug resistance protein